MPITYRSNRTGTDPRGVGEVFTRNLQKDPVHQIRAQIAIFLLKFVPIMDDFVFNIFEQVGFFANVGER